MLSWVCPFRYEAELSHCAFKICHRLLAWMLDVRSRVELQNATGRALGTRPVTQEHRLTRPADICECLPQVAPFYPRRQSIELSDFSNTDKWRPARPLGGVSQGVALCALKSAIACSRGMRLFVTANTARTPHSSKVLGSDGYILPG